VFGDRHVVELRQRPDAGPLAVLTRASADNDYGPRTGRLHLFDHTTGTIENLGPVAAEARSLAWWPAEDGWHLGYVALTPPVLHAGTAVFDLALGSRVLRNRTAGLSMCPTNLCQTDSAPLVVFADGLNTTLARLDRTDLTTLSQHPGRLDDPTTSIGGRLAVLTGSRYRSADVHVGPPAGPLRRITDTRPELDGIPLGKQQPLAYRAADGLDLDGLLVLPAGRTASEGPFPLVTIVHGGPYDRYADRCQLFWIPSAQWLAAAGYAVFLPNPRGGQGQGHEFAARFAGRVGQEEWTDILTGIDLLIAQGIADPDRLGIAGWSHGGFMSAWAVGQTDRSVPRWSAPASSTGACSPRPGRTASSKPRSGAAPAGPASARTRMTRSARSPSPAASALPCSSCTAPRTPTSLSARRCTSTGRCATSASSTSS
jgi:dipeptidyl aminopeptidase/acylaminoacyl peptidase